MSYPLTPIWGDDSLAFQWGDFTTEEQSCLRGLHRQWNIVLAPTGEAFQLARQARDHFAEYFAALQDGEIIDRRLRLVFCFVDQGKRVGCNAYAFSLASSLSCSQPTYGIHVNIHAIEALQHRSRLVAEVLMRKLAARAQLQSEMEDSSGGSDLTLIAIVFVMFHELAHIVRGHLEWTPAINKPCDQLSPAEQEIRRALELDADYIGAFHCARSVRLLYASRGIEHSASEDFLQGQVAVISLYSMLSLLREGESRGQSCACYHSAIARLMLVQYKLSETMEIDRKVTISLVHLLMEGLCEASKEDRRLTTILDLDPLLHRTELDELEKKTAPFLAELERLGRLRGWLTRSS